MDKMNKVKAQRTSNLIKTKGENIQRGGSGRSYMEISNHINWPLLNTGDSNTSIKTITAMTLDSRCAIKTNEAISHYYY